MKKTPINRKLYNKILKAVIEARQALVAEECIGKLIQPINNVIANNVYKAVARSCK